MGGLCAHCNQDAHLRCSRCKLVFYCDSQHQRAHWPDHKNLCFPRHIQEDELNFYINIDLDRPDEIDPIEGNKFISPQARVSNISVTLENLKFPSRRSYQTFDEKSIPEFLKKVTLKPYNTSLHTFFTDLFATETQERHSQEKQWCGAVDNHHIFYEKGYPPNIEWGS